jgi:hypothetical protein
MEAPMYGHRNYGRPMMRWTDGANEDLEAIELILETLESVLQAYSSDRSVGPSLVPRLIVEFRPLVAQAL